MNGRQRTAFLAKGYTYRYVGNIMKIARGSDLGLQLKLHAGQDYGQTDRHRDNVQRLVWPGSQNLCQTIIKWFLIVSTSLWGCTLHIRGNISWKMNFDWLIWWAFNIVFNYFRAAFLKAIWIDLCRINPMDSSKLTIRWIDMVSIHLTHAWITFIERDSYQTSLERWKWFFLFPILLKPIKLKIYIFSLGEECIEHFFWSGMYWWIYLNSYYPMTSNHSGFFKLAHYDHRWPRSRCPD